MSKRHEAARVIIDLAKSIDANAGMLLRTPEAGAVARPGIVTAWNRMLTIAKDYDLDEIADLAIDDAGNVYEGGRMAGSAYAVVSEKLAREGLYDLARAVVPVPSEVKPDAVDHPPHYNDHPAGIECIDVVEHMSFNVGNAIKYLWRAGKKGDHVEDLKKARWYIDREIKRMAAQRSGGA